MLFGFILLLLLLTSSPALEKSLEKRYRDICVRLVEVVDTPVSKHFFDTAKYRLFPV